MNTYKYLYSHLFLGLLFSVPVFFSSLLADDSNATSTPAPPAAATPTPAPTFMVKAGEFPWSDRVGIWQLTSVPASIDGTGPLPQQNCGDRSLVVPDGVKSILLGVSNKDVDAFKADFPDAQPTNEAISVVHADGTGEIPYSIFKMVNPPAIIGDKPFVAGLILLQASDTVNTLISAASTPPPATPAAPTQAAPFKPPQNPFDTGDKTKLHIYILMGQSNMVGRDTTGLESQTTDPRIGYFDGKNWIIAIEPMRGGSGFGPGIFFAQVMLPGYPDGKIGLVPCAVGGTPLSRWVKGADLYENALKRAQQAAASGVIEGMLWHQGESDSTTPENASSYMTRLTQMFSDFRADLGQPDLPIVVGQLGEFFKAPQSDVVKAALQQMPGALPHVGFADSTGLTDKGDHLHFSAASQKEFGKRYAEAMQKLQQPATAPAPASAP